MFSSTSTSTTDWFLLMIFVPCALGFLRSSFSSEIEYWVGAFFAFHRRPYDLDRNPKTHDWCYLQNGASGDWSPVSLTYNFSVFRGQNGVFVHYYDHDWELERVERVPFDKWGGRCKARMNPDNLPQGLPLLSSN